MTPKSTVSKYRNASYYRARKATLTGFKGIKFIGVSTFEIPPDFRLQFLVKYPVSPCPFYLLKIFSV